MTGQPRRATTSGPTTSTSGRSQYASSRNGRSRPVVAASGTPTPSMGTRSADEHARLRAVLLHPRGMGLDAAPRPQGHAPAVHPRARRAGADRAADLGLRDARDAPDVEPRHGLRAV